MAVGRTPMQPGLLSSTAGFCEGRLAPNSIYAVLHRECRALFPDEMLADLFAEDGRRSVPPMTAQDRARSADPAWLAAYRATRPKVERKIAHLMRRRHGGRRARVRGRAKVGADFSLLAAAANIARLGVLGIMSTASGNWVVAAG
ncbi:transposase [Streptomyces sp. NPDC006510]|uniref:transposase n=1 Tax=Streptomyces sp. NPDC006510 TaxID=3155600 RepID=UPI0033AA1E5C